MIHIPLNSKTGRGTEFSIPRCQPLPQRKVG
jgi:hypothetical protein